MNGGSGASQPEVDAFFDASVEYWREVYEDQGVQGVVYRERMGTVLGWVRDLPVPTAARALDVGCGAGLMSVELARIGYSVHGTDSSPEMVEETRRGLVERGLADRVAVSVADVHALGFPAGSFAVVTALGVLPWLHDEAAAVAEMARVLAPGGHLVLTADNGARLNALLEPHENPLLAPARGAVRAWRRWRGRPGPQAVARRHRPAAVDRMLEGAGLVPVRRRSVGFGPFTFRWRPVLGNAAGLRLHEALQHRADKGVPVLRAGGWHYVVMARKPG